MTVNLTFTHHATTKGTYRYQELDAQGQIVQQRDAVVGALYIRKAAFGDAPPSPIIEVRIKTT